MKLDNAPLRERLNAVVASGVRVAEVARRMQIAPEALSRFRGGAPWGGLRLARLNDALNSLAVPAAEVPPSPITEPTENPPEEQP